MARSMCIWPSISWRAFAPGIHLAPRFPADLIAVAIFSFCREASTRSLSVRNGFLFFCGFLSVFQGSVPKSALYYCWQLGRVFFFYAVVSRACAADERVGAGATQGHRVWIFFFFGQAIWERFGVGVLETAGGFPHRNPLGMVSHFIVYPFFALLLAGESSWFPITVSLAGAPAPVLRTFPRYNRIWGFGYVVVFLLSAMRG